MDKNILSKISVPFDEIAIPSKGMFYDGNQSSFMVKYLTAQEENVLTSPTLVESGKAIEMVLSSCILNWDGDVNDILVGDKNAVLLYLRSTSYGDEFKFKYHCPNCKKESEGKFPLSSLEMKEVDIKPDDDGLFSYTLPTMALKLTDSGDTEDVVIKFKPRTVGDEIEIERMTRDDKKQVGQYEFDKSIESRYKVQIKSINGYKSKKFINAIIRRMPLADSVKLREFMDKVEPGVDNVIGSECQHCTFQTKNVFPIESDFFGLNPEYKQNMMDEIFLISYYGQGGITRKDAYSMPVYERRWTMQRISEEVDKKNQAEKAAANKAKRDASKRGV